jgi:hypothetical protein
MPDQRLAAGFSGIVGEHCLWDYPAASARTDERWS